MKEFKGTKGEWSINHWKQGGSGATCIEDSNGITHYTGDNVRREVYNIVSNLHPNSHKIEHSFEGAHIAEIAARSEESLANAQLIAAAPELLRALLEWKEANVMGDAEMLSQARITRDIAIKKALGL